ncbi:PREDICTED: endoplasmic reticulum-Golgi intermediate compartment protein 2-like, partial [Priapulus caudatus]|uniref:Endoplasmic reticulum-Golgi intermediate compartment protein 2-like n=1 Tax=Priapulus caudatus TaxID=37621 RepID=A0ABM1EX46_PRICU
MRRLNKKSTLKVVKELDAFPKIPESYQQTTSAGGTVSILCFLLISILVFMEFRYYSATEMRYDYEVDGDFSSKLNISVDITVASRCEMIGADILDLTYQNAASFGRLKEELTYFELSKNQRAYWDMIRSINGYIKEEYHAVHKLLWKTGYVQFPNRLPEREEKPTGPPDACRFYGVLTVNKLAGNFHVTAGKCLRSGSLTLSNWCPKMSQIRVTEVSQIGGHNNDARTIDKYNLGEVERVSGMLHAFVGFLLDIVCCRYRLGRYREQPDALLSEHVPISQLGNYDDDEINAMSEVPPGGVTFLPQAQPSLTHGAAIEWARAETDGSLTNPFSLAANQMYQYFIKVVPTKVNTNAVRTDTHQYSVTERERAVDHAGGSHGVPGIYFKYDVAGLKVSVTEQHKSYWQFLVRLSGIIGGVFATS